MPNIRLIAINGSAGAIVNILASIPCKYCEGREDESVTAQGLTYTTIEDNFTSTYTVGVPGTPDTPQIRVPAIANELSGGYGRILGYPAQAGIVNTTAGQLLGVRSKTVTATSLRFKEQE